MTKANSELWGIKFSCAKLSKRLMASRNVPAVRTCSHVSVVKLAKRIIRHTGGAQT